jgi:AraC-like DNA-binding protein
LLRRYIRSLERSGLTAFGNDPTIARRHIIDLMVLAATPHRSVGESNSSAVAAAHLHAIFDHIASHFSDPELSLSKVAQSMRISTRYVQRLLKTSGTSFTAHVTEVRLNHAFALLTARGKSDLHIYDIALRAGFFRYLVLQPAFPFPLWRYAKGRSCEPTNSALRKLVRCLVLS